ADPTRPLSDTAVASEVVDASGLGPQLVGTPIYMAPEVWRGEPGPPRSDLYSLGILLYELLAGTAPHRNVGLHQLADAVQHRDIPPLGDAAPGIEPAMGKR